jgi:hypothetical protein
MENSRIDTKNIKGWGIDADPLNEPTYPMKKYTGDDHQRLNYQRPPQQEGEVKDFHSIERPGMSAVYGTSVPPVGLSGAMRRYAFKYSENHYGHWLTLLLADRVNVIEGIVADLKRGHIPNIFAEKGMKAEWKYNTKKMTTKVLTIAAVVTVCVLLKRKKSKFKIAL